MAGYGYKAGRKYKNNYKKGNYNYGWNKQNSVISRAWKSIKEANKSNSSIDFAFKINYAFSAKFDKDTHTGVAAINVYEVLFRSENFRNMMKNYDQVKVNGVTARINVTDFSVATASTAVNVVTGWDKTGLSVIRNNSGDNFGDVEFYSDALNVDDSLILPTNYDNPAKKALYFRNVIGERIADGYGCKKGLLNSYQRFSRYESCFPSTIDEKACYVPTANFDEYITGYDPATAAFTISGDYSDGNVGDQIVAPNPCIPFENLAIKWKPTLLVGVFKTTNEASNTNPHGITQYGSCAQVIFNAEFTIPVTFKGQKGDR